MDSDTPNIAAMQAIAVMLGASLMVDVAHDLGCLGPDGIGYIGLQKMLSKVDLVMGSFSKTFGSSGGFAAISQGISEVLQLFMHLLELTVAGIEDMMAERGVIVDHSTLHRWLIRLVSLLD